MMKWLDLGLAICIGVIAAAALCLLTYYADDVAGQVHMYSTEMLFGLIVGLGALVWVRTEKK